jgi:hypothetical protein
MNHTCANRETLGGRSQRPTANQSLNAIVSSRTNREAATHCKDCALEQAASSKTAWPPAKPAPTNRDIIPCRVACTLPFLDHRCRDTNRYERYLGCLRPLAPRALTKLRWYHSTYIRPRLSRLKLRCSGCSILYKMVILTALNTDDYSLRPGQSDSHIEF